jgi:antitoxin HicB
MICQEMRGVSLSNGRTYTSAGTVRYRVLIEQDEGGVFVAECPSLPGCISQGMSREEVLGNIQDAIRGYLESLKKHNEPIPPSIEEEIVEVTI